MAGFLLDKPWLTRWNSCVGLSDKEDWEVIRQAISCDICGTEKKQTNHWFVAYERNGELRLSGWQSKQTLRPKAKHLCGQKCVHRLLDEFMAGVSSMMDAIGTSLEKPATNQLDDVVEGAVLVQTYTSLLSPEEPQPFSTTEDRRKIAWKHELERQNKEVGGGSKAFLR